MLEDEDIEDDKTAEAYEIFPAKFNSFYDFVNFLFLSSFRTFLTAIYLY